MRERKRDRGRKPKKVDILIWTTLGGYQFFLSAMCWFSSCWNPIETKLETLKHADERWREREKWKQSVTEMTLIVKWIKYLPNACRRIQFIHSMFFYAHFHLRLHSIWCSVVGFNSIKEIYELKSVRTHLLLLWACRCTMKYTLMRLKLLNKYFDVGNNKFNDP